MNKSNEKIFENYLTNQRSYGIIYIEKDKRSPKKGIDFMNNIHGFVFGYKLTSQEFEALYCAWLKR